MTTVNANEIALGIESFGDDDAPLVLLAGGTTMLSWPDAFCERLAAGGRRSRRCANQAARYLMGGRGSLAAPGSRVNVHSSEYQGVPALESAGCGSS